IRPRNARTPAAAWAPLSRQFGRARRPASPDAWGPESASVWRRRSAALVPLPPILLGGEEPAAWVLQPDQHHVVRGVIAEAAHEGHHLLERRRRAIQSRLPQQGV